METEIHKFLLSYILLKNILAKSNIIWQESTYMQSTPPECIVQYCELACDLDAQLTRKEFTAAAQREWFNRARLGYKAFVFVL
jgi:hypothetical protein